MVEVGDVSMSMCTRSSVLDAGPFSWQKLHTEKGGWHEFELSLKHLKINQHGPREVVKWLRQGRNNLHFFVKISQWSLAQLLILFLSESS